MLRDKAFLFQVALLFFFTFGLAFWLLNGAPMLVATVKPLEPSAEVPTFEEHIAKQMKRDFNGNEITVEFMQRQTLNGLGYSIISGGEYYEKNECRGESRRHLIGRINHFDKYRRLYPAIELATSGDVTDDTVEEAINSLFLDSLLTVEEFPAATRKWLGTFARPGSEDRAEYLRQCQNKR